MRAAYEGPQKGPRLRNGWAQAVETGISFQATRWRLDYEDQILSTVRGKRRDLDITTSHIRDILKFHQVVRSSRLLHIDVRMV